MRQGPKPPIALSDGRWPRNRFRSLFFHRALQRVLVAAREIHHLRHFRLGHLERKHAHDRKALLVDRQHDVERLRVVQPEEPLQHMDDKLHRRIIVIEQHHLVEGRTLGLCLRLGQNRRVLAWAIGLVRHGQQA
jgi:hypothetical protein